MLQQFQVSGYNLASEALHGKMKLRIIILHVTDVGKHGDTGIQFLPDFPDQGFLRRFPRFDLSAGKLPVPFPVTVSPLCGKNPALMKEEGGNDPDLFHLQFLLSKSGLPPFSGCPDS